MEPQSVHERRRELQILDVREDDEWSAGHIDGARHIALDALPARVAELDRARPVVTVCRSGNRSGKAAAALTRAGLTVHNMDGGMRRWARDGLPISGSDGRPGRVA